MIRIWITLTVFFIKDINNALNILPSVTCCILVYYRYSKIENLINLTFIFIRQAGNIKLSSVMVKTYVVRILVLLPYIIHSNHLRPNRIKIILSYVQSDVVQYMVLIFLKLVFIFLRFLMKDYINLIVHDIKLYFIYLIYIMPYMHNSVL